MRGDGRRRVLVEWRWEERCRLLVAPRRSLPNPSTPGSPLRSLGLRTRPLPTRLSRVAWPGTRPSGCRPWCSTAHPVPSVGHERSVDPGSSRGAESWSSPSTTLGPVRHRRRESETGEGRGSPSGPRVSGKVPGTMTTTDVNPVERTGVPRGPSGTVSDIIRGNCSVRGIPCRSSSSLHTSRPDTSER